MTDSTHRRPGWLVEILIFLGLIREWGSRVLAPVRLWRKLTSSPAHPKLFDWRPGKEREGFVRVEIWSRGPFRAPLRIDTFPDGTECRSVADEVLVWGGSRKLRKKLRFKGLKQFSEEETGYHLLRRSKLSGLLPWRPKLLDWLPRTESLLERLQDKFGFVSRERNEVFGAAIHLNEEQWGNTLVQVEGAQELLQPQNLEEAESIRLAVVDSGIDPCHRELTRNVDKENSKSFLSRVSCCKKRRGYMDERHSHGTACSGLIAAEVNNDDLEGVGLNPSIMAVKFLDEDGLGTAADADRSIRYAVNKGVRILLLAWGGSCPSAVVKEALEYAGCHNVVVVAAAGNRGEELARADCDFPDGARPFYPASYKLDNMLVVGATKREITEVDQDGRKPQIEEELAPGSNYGPHVDLGAPGLLCKTTRRSHRGSQRMGYESARYGYFSGTSAAAAYVAGACALVRLKLKLDGCSDPRYQDVIQAILDGCCKVRDLPFKCCRRLDALGAVQKARNRANGEIDRGTCPPCYCNGNDDVSEDLQSPDHDH